MSHTGELFSQDMTGPPRNRLLSTRRTRSKGRLYARHSHFYRHVRSSARPPRACGVVGLARSDKPTPQHFTCVAKTGILLRKPRVKNALGVSLAAMVWRRVARRNKGILLLRPPGWFLRSCQRLDRTIGLVCAALFLAPLSWCLRLRLLLLRCCRGLVAGGEGRWGGEVG